MGKTKSYTEIANDYNLWGEYVDPQATMTEDEFNEMTEAEKVEMQKDLFGADESQDQTK